ncbi:hypothetical protein [Ekhidna sp.]|uniref:hypothetical protein n=1 Tax=Ekhidna sp. TaxID=2608089 RepID=UPI0032971DBE
MKELLKMGRSYVLVIISLLSAHINFAQSSSSSSFDQFISRKTIKVDSLEVAGRINQFLNYEIDKSGLTWFEGNITTSENIQYSDLKMNFNVFSNSLYLLFENNVYRVSNFSIKGFDIFQKEVMLKFRKGYAVPFRTIVLAIINDTPQNVLEYLAEFEEWKKLNIKEVTIVDSDPSQVTIELNTGFRGQLNSLKKYLEANETLQR